MRTPSPVEIKSRLKTKILEMEVTEGDGLYDFVMTVHWEPIVHVGTRFAHTRGSDEEVPFHSEAISALALNEISDGKQMLRGLCSLKNGTILVLEVWQDSYRDIKVLDAEMLLTKL